MREKRACPVANAAEALFCLTACLCLSGCHTGPDPERELRSQFRRITGQIGLPAGTVDLHAPLQFEPGAHDIEVRGHASGSVLRLAGDFQGRAAIVGHGMKNVRLAGFHIVGARPVSPTNVYLPGSNTPFADFYEGNGIVFTDSRGITIRDVSLKGIAAFPVLISHSGPVTLESLTIEDSGTLNSLGHSNTTGGILLEQGTTGFAVRNCRIRNVSGNGIWTHSNYGSPLNEDGVISGNEIWGTPRDAIQVGHARRVQVLNNTGGNVGYPAAQADLPAQATPAALDSAGDVSATLYSGNRFEDVNGKCIDLDGFHDGRVVDNSCVNRKPAREYPLSHVGIVFGNTNPDMEPRNVVVTGNLIQGFGYGGVYVLGAGHQISANRFIDVNRNHCTGDMRIPGCNYAPDEPGMLRSGIYFASHAARPADTKDNTVRGNYISGFGMGRWCIAAAPGVILARNKTAANTCVETNP
jgi:hypothetical protein